MNYKKAILPLLLLMLKGFVVNAQISKIKASFAHPGDAYKPGVYWYFMDGNMSAQTITKDLEEMKKAGIGNLVFLEVNVGVPRGPVEFLSDEWTFLFVHAEKEARRLGIEITLGIGPGWTGSGGPWVKGNQSMKHLVSSSVTVSAGDRDIKLPTPQPKKPFFGEDNLSSEVKKQWHDYYEDVAVLAFPAGDKGDEITSLDEKALYVRAPYSSTVTVPYLPSTSTKKDKNGAIAKKQIIDLTGKMKADGTLNWSPPAGKWVVMRFGSRNNGAITRPAPVPGLGFEADKFDTTALNSHLENYVGKLLKKIGGVNKNIPGGLKRLHMDSWEMGAQNWTAKFREEFIKRRGYDPLKYYPVYSGITVGSLEESERFLWDLRQTSQELILENHAGHVKAYAKRHGLNLSIEPYDMNPTADLELGSVADVPMGEFWSKGFGFNASFSVIEATSIAHVMGKSLVPSEAFTAQDNEGWKQHPASMKNQGDWAFAAGINRFVYHTFQNQFLADSLKPGATMGPYGVHWDRSQTWWPMVGGYHDYITRCQYLLQQGRTVADILYLTPEGSPHVFVPPSSAILGDTIGDRRGFNFDGCAPGQLMKASVINGNIVFPGGATYRVMVLPVVETMTPELLAKIGSLIKLGATVIGSPPLRSPSLVGYPLCDERIKTLGKQIFGTLGNNIDKETRHQYGKGTLIWGGEFSKNIDHLYPTYEVVANFLKSKNVKEDFVADGQIRYTHRTSTNWDIYFLSNKTDKPVNFKGQFRTMQGSPELWNAITGKTMKLDAFKVSNGITTVPLQLGAYESCFIVSSADNKWKASTENNSVSSKTLLTLTGPWKVNFDPKWGGPASIVFDTLSDWTKSKVDGIKYYSGIASYNKMFDVETVGASAVYLDMGKVKNLVRVTLNGKDLGVIWTAPWRIDISSALKEKDNRLTIEVANLWPNRLIGDELKPYDGIVDDKWPEWLLKGKPRTSGRYTFTSTQQYSAKSPLLESGLMSPVTIVQEVKSK